MGEGFSRRQFLALSGGVGAGMLVGACSSGGSGAATSSAAAPATTSAGAAVSSAAGAVASGGPQVTGEQITGQVWGGVWEKAIGQIAPMYTTATGNKAVFSVAAGGQLPTIQQNAGKYDCAWLIGSDAAQGFKTGVLDAIDRSKVPALEKVIPALVNGQVVDGQLTGVPISYGATGILWRKDKVPFEITSWKDLWRPELKGQIAIQNAPSIGGLFLVYAGGASFGNGPDDFAAGWDAVKKLKDNVQYLYTISSDPINKLANGSVWVAVTFADQGLPLKDRNVEVTLPSEGMPWSLQNLTIPAKAKHKDVAYNFINYMLENNTQIEWSKDATIAPASTAVTLPTAVQSAIVETSALSSKLWPINWLQLGENIPDWTKQWQQIFTG